MIEVVFVVSMTSNGLLAGLLIGLVWGKSFKAEVKNLIGKIDGK